jgi:invasion protein IalB
LTCAGQAVARRCEVAQQVQNRERRYGATIALGRAQPGQPLKLVVRVPVNVTIASAVQLAMDASDVTALAFRTCNAGGCYAEMELRDDALLGRMRARPPGQQGRIAWHDAANNGLALPVSFRGLAAALDALAREGR